jgi:8-oxo-dGTP pyrophosphatase MutT (NUDIX family)
MLMPMVSAWLSRVSQWGRSRGRRHSGGPPGLFAARCPVGAACLIRDDTGCILLVQQSYRTSPIWLPPGGWVDRGETPQQAACREAREEVGLHVTIGRPLAIGGGGYGELTVLFEAAIVGEPILTLSDEIERAAFFPPDALPSLANQTHRWLTEAFAALDAGAAAS